MFKGVYTALVTPFKDNGDVDYPSLDRLVDFQLEQKIDGLVVCGTTGESATMSAEEQLTVLENVCKKVDGKVPVIFGSGSNCTESTIKWSQRASEYPIDGLLVVVPYYNKPPQEGMKAHFLKVAENVSKPIILYNVPGRTVASLAPETIIELSQHPNIVGIKEADSDLNNFSKYKNLVPEDFSLLSGDDETCVSFCFLGGHGVVSVCSNLAPGAMVGWIKQALNRDEKVRESFREQLRWIQSLYLTANPIPVKAALKEKGIIDSCELRLPLVKINEELKSKMLSSFKDFKDLI